MEVHLNRLSRCCHIALKANGYQKTNPLVGAMLVINDQIIAEGWHTAFGNPHAEVEVLNQITEFDSFDQAYKILYVSLEPCCHQGKTPPCTNLIISNGINEVHIGVLDPNPIVSGSGIKILVKAGIKVFLHNHLISENLINPFKTIVKDIRPYIILKWAQSADGFIGRAGEKIWLSNQGSIDIVHQMRNKVDAIFVGNNTLKNDKPALSSRVPPFKNPKKIVLDISGKLDLNWLDEWLSAGDFYFTSKKVDSDLSISSKINQIKLNTSETEYTIEIWNELLTHLYQAHIGSILIEGGAKVLQFLIDHQLWDELIVIKTSVNLESGIKAPIFESVPTNKTNIMGDQIAHYFNRALHSSDNLESIYF